jgi:hypothetical protein
MFSKWIVMIAVAIMFGLPVFPAFAQEPTPENDTNCVACHEHQYYLYDSGKWFCLCEAPMHCVYCHGGRTDSQVKETAHEGLVLYPTRDHAKRCQTCHTEDYLSRVVAFTTVAGVSSTPRSIITATPVKPIAATKEESTSNRMLLHLGQLAPWQMVGICVVGIALIIISIAGYRCWKNDCLQKLHTGS